MLAEIELIVHPGCGDNSSLDHDGGTTRVCQNVQYIEAGMLQKSLSWFERYHCKGKMSSECYSASIDAFGEHAHILEAEKAFICCQERKNVLSGNQEKKKEE
ncbi:hypothetical protein IFM89_026657 [Coptis chinensis]|uniref:Uncharacterized protein n=1 Tax=Coptis chinensis TaxID=261450 RepID=A0A835IXV0_9MAGN|nr:hypothetical protein IFM89_026657 [Coptis chinensis]